MAWNISDRFPSWGETGEFPPAGFFYEGGNQVNQKHLDALWNGLNELEGEVQAALADIDSDSDGRVDAADTANLYKGNDIDSNGDGKVDNAENADYATNSGNADTLDGNDATAFASSSHPSDTTNPHNVTNDQTGAATALSNHENVSDVHHIRPTSTTSTNVDHWPNLSKQQGSINIGLSDDNGPKSVTLSGSSVHHDGHEFIISGKIYVEAEINMDYSEKNGADYELYDFEIQRWDGTWEMIDDSKLIETRLDGTGGTDTETYSNTYNFTPKRIQQFRITTNQYDVGGGGSTSTYGSMTIRPAQAKTSDHNHNI